MSRLPLAGIIRDVLHRLTQEGQVKVAAVSRVGVLTISHESGKVFADALDALCRPPFVIPGGTIWVKHEVGADVQLEVTSEIPSSEMFDEEAARAEAAVLQERMATVGGRLDVTLEGIRGRYRVTVPLHDCQTPSTNRETPFTPPSAQHKSAPSLRRGTPQT